MSMKEALVVGVLVLLAAAGGAWLFVKGSPFAHTEAPAAVSFALLTKGDQSGEVPPAVNYRVTNTDELAMLWTMLGRTDAMPEVDFTMSEVLAVFDEERPSAGYAVEVVSVSDANDTRTVTIRHLLPGESCTNAQMLTKPYVLITVPKTTLPLTHARESVTVPCE